MYDDNGYDDPDHDFDLDYDYKREVDEQQRDYDYIPAEPEVVAYPDLVWKCDKCDKPTVHFHLVGADPRDWIRPRVVPSGGE